MRCPPPAHIPTVDSMVPLALLSIPVYIAQLADNDDTWVMILWCICVCLWSSTFLKLWSKLPDSRHCSCRKRCSCELRYDWDIDDDAALGYKKKTRAQFVAPVEPGKCMTGLRSLVSGFYSQGGWVDLSKYVDVVPNQYRDRPEIWANKFDKGWHHLQAVASVAGRRRHQICTGRDIDDCSLQEKEMVNARPWLLTPMLQVVHAQL